MKEKSYIKNKGITLIALVVTIIVLLILAGISIMMLTGQNGILNRAGEAKEKTGLAQINESVKLAVADALTKGTGSITRDNLEDALNKYVGEDNYELTDVSDGWTISAGGKEYHVSSTGGISEDNNDGNDETSLGGIYSVGGITEQDIAPADLFYYSEPDETNMTVTILGIDAKYCNGAAKTQQEDEDSSYPNGTNYDIIYNDKTISDTLIIPYKYEKDGKEYTVTTACANANGSRYSGKRDISGRMPHVKTIIYPNTVKEITEGRYWYPEGTYEGPTKIVLPNKLEKIGNWEFTGCSSLQEINLPDTLTSIGNMAFSNCTGIKTITISKNVKKLGYMVFRYWTSSQEILIEGTTEEWDNAWNDDCNATKNYLK